MRKRNWYKGGLVYFSALFVLIPAVASAYIDPSITSYAIQAIAGIVIASGAFFAAYGRRAKKGWLKALGAEETEIRIREKDVEVYDEDLRGELEARREAARRADGAAAGGPGRHLRRRILLSLLCGFTVSITVILRPALSLYRSNEREFWFPLSDILPCLLIVFLSAGLAAALVHFLLPDRKKASLRLLFAALCAAGALCVFIQNHFLSSYLPVLTGDPIDWSRYSGWNIASAALWAGVFAALTVPVFIRSRAARIVSYSLLAVLLCAETVTGVVEAASLTNRNEKRNAFFSEDGMYETSVSGNIVVIVSDTFEGTYMNRVLEKYPEYRETLSDITFYDNMSGTSVFTNYSYPKILTGVDLPVGAFPQDGMAACFDSQTTLDRVLKNGWEIGYYTTFAPTASIRDKVVNYSDQPMHPSPAGAWGLTKLLIRNSLFRSAPNQLKQRFVTGSLDYELLKSTRVNADPYIEDDQAFYFHIRDNGLEAVDSAPRYLLFELWGIHEPSHFDANVEYVTYPEDMPIDEKKTEAARAQLTILREYLDQLKAAGTYDDTTVIMTADHGYRMRFWPVFLVKEAHRAENGFRTDHTPLSMQDDYEDLLDALTSGKTFSEAAAAYTDESRVRHALDFRADKWLDRVSQRSFVEILGPAGDPESYRYVREEFVRDEDFTGRCEINRAFISGGTAEPDVAVYGCNGTNVYGHTVLFDAFFSEETERAPTFRAVLANRTGRPQRVSFTIDGKKTGETFTLEPDAGKTEVSVSLPGGRYSRVTLEMNLPDAVPWSSETDEALGFNDYRSVKIREAGFYDTDE